MSSNKLLIITTIVLILIFIGVGAYFLTQKKTFYKGEEKTETSKPTKQVFESKDFSIIVPEGWSTERQLPSTLVTITKIDETHPQDPDAQRINFKSYMAVSFSETHGRSVSQIIESTKQEITAMIPSTKLISEKDYTIDGMPAKVHHLKLIQQEVDFTAIVIMVAKGDKYFGITFNTPTSRWTEYQDLFYKTADSFKFRY